MIILIPFLLRQRLRSSINLSLKGFRVGLGLKLGKRVCMLVSSFSHVSYCLLINPNTRCLLLLTWWYMSEKVTLKISGSCFGRLIIWCEMTGKNLRRSKYMWPCFFYCTNVKWGSLGALETVRSKKFHF